MPRPSWRWFRRAVPRLQALAEEGHRGARAALALLDDPTRLLSSVQVGITLVGILTGVYSGAAYSAELAAWIPAVTRCSRPMREEIAFGAIVVVMTYFSLVLGELVPKRLAMAHADRWATLVAVPMQFLAKVGAPVVWLLQRSTDALLRLMPTPSATQHSVTDDDVRALAAEGMQNGGLHRHEAEMIDSVLRLADRSIDAIMVPRGDILWLDVDEPVATLWDEARRSGHARFLLCRGELEQLIGVISLANLGEALRRGAIDVERRRAAAAARAGEHLDLQAARDLPPLQRAPRRGHQRIRRHRGAGHAGRHPQGDCRRHAGDGQPRLGQRVQREDGSWLIDGHLPIHEAERALGRARSRAATTTTTPWPASCCGTSGACRCRARSSPGATCRIEVVDMDGLVIDKLLVQPRTAQGLRSGS